MDITPENWVLSDRPVRNLNLRHNLVMSVFLIISAGDALETLMAENLQLQEAR